MVEANPVELNPAGLEPSHLEKIPQHVAIVMDGNGRWANARGLPRTAGHQAGEHSLMDVVAGGVQLGLPEMSVFAFSTENWKRSPEEVRFLMGFSRSTIHDDRDTLDNWNVRVRWAGRRTRLWASVLREIRQAEFQTRNNTGMTLNLCLNYGGHAEIADAARAIAEDVAAGRLRPADVTEQTVADRLYLPDMRPVDLFIRTSGEFRTSNFLPWQSAYAEYYVTDVAWPDFGRRQLWEACRAFGGRERRFGGAVDRVRSEHSDEG